MAGTVREAKLNSRATRARLKRGRQPHWRTIIVGRVHLGYQRWPEDQEGRWLLRRYLDGKYRVVEIGKADDRLEADGEHVWSFDQAQANAMAQVDAPKAKVHRMTVRQAFERYIEHKAHQGQPTGDALSRGKVHILPALGDIVVADLTSEHLRRWLSAMAAMPAMLRRGKSGKPNYRPAPVGDEQVRRRRNSSNRVLAIVKAALNYAFDEGLVNNNEAWGRRVKPFREANQPRVRYLSVAEATRLVNACEPDFRSLVRGALETGCRYSELTRLEVADFNPDAGTLAIRKSKSGKARHVVLTDEGASFFRQQVLGRAGDALILTRADGKPWGDCHQVARMRLACSAGRITPPISFHGLRHTWASLAVMGSAPLLVVAKNLGHADTKMVERHYGHLAPSFIADAIRAGAPKFGFEPDHTVTPLVRGGR
jgi:integrase